MGKELLVKLKWRRRVYRMWQEGQTTWEEYGNVVRTYMEATRKAESHPELYLARNVKDNKKGCFRYISSRWKTGENVGPLLNEVGVLVMEDKEKAELLNAAFASVFTAKVGPQASQSLDVREKAWRKEDLPSAGEDQASNHLSKLDSEGCHQWHWV